MTRFISHIHSDLRGARPARRGATMHPDAVPRGTHKEYPRFPRIQLPAAPELSMTLSDALARRASFVRARSVRPFTEGELGSLLGHALGMRKDPARHYPSGGALYPIETYLIGDIVEGFAPGVFHYHPKAHALEHLWDAPDFDMARIIQAPITPLSRALLVFTGVWGRSSAKYGDWAYHLAMLEAGHMGQNILLTATALQMQARPAGGFDDDIVSNMLDLDEREQPLYSIVLAPNAAAHQNDEAVYE